MTLPLYTAGNWIRCSVVFSPQSGSVALGDVSAWTIVGAARTTTSVTAASASSSGILAGAVNPITRAISALANAFYVDVLPPDAAQQLTWIIRWESNSPSPKITVEETMFAVLASKSPTP